MTIKVRLAITLPILNEYCRVLDELTKKHPLPLLSSILEVIELQAEMVEPVSFAETVCSDPDDDKFLEAALAADADYVVSGDAALLRYLESENFDGFSRKRQQQSHLVFYPLCFAAGGTGSIPVTSTNLIPALSMTYVAG